MSERCEWNPIASIPASDPPVPGDCPNDATVCVGRADPFHLCASCAALPVFARRKHRSPLRAPATTEKEPTIPGTPSRAAEAFAKYHDERAGYGGVGWEFHARAATFLRDCVPLSEHQRVLAEAAAKDAALRAEQAFSDFGSALFDAGEEEWSGYLLSSDEARQLREEADRLRAEALAPTAGSGWLSPEEAERLRAQAREKTLDELALAIGFGERPWGQSGVHRPDDLAEAIRQALKERDDEIDRRGAYVDAWDEYFRAAKGGDRERRQLAAISKACDAWERDTDPEDR